MPTSGDLSAALPPDLTGLVAPDMARSTAQDLATTDLAPAKIKTGDFILFKVGNGMVLSGAFVDYTVGTEMTTITTQGACTTFKAVHGGMIGSAANQSARAATAKGPTGMLTLMPDITNQNGGNTAQVFVVPGQTAYSPGLARRCRRSRSRSEGC